MKRNSTFRQKCRSGSHKVQIRIIESLEEENHLLDINAQELAKLNDNVFKLRTEVENTVRLYTRV